MPCGNMPTRPFNSYGRKNSRSNKATPNPRLKLRMLKVLPLSPHRPLKKECTFDGEHIRATGYGDLAKGLYLCQHSADLAARVELSKLVRVQVTEKSVDRIRERTGKDAEQDIEVVREGLVNEVLTGVRIVNRNVDKDAGTCSSTAVIPKKNLSTTPVSSGDANLSAPQ
jgi:hypothetical protein